MKKCNKCNETKSLDDFTPNGLKTNVCKVCVRENNLKNRLNPQSVRNKWGGGVYFIVKKDGAEIVYIGQTKNLYNRKTEHFNKGKKTSSSVLHQFNLNPSEYEFVIHKREDNKDERLKIENRFIQLYMPVLNKNMNKLT